MPDHSQFRNDVRDALVHLYDPAYLEAHPLARQLIGRDLPRTLSRGQALRALLKETIEALRPAEHVPSHMPEWRSYRALYYRYIKGMGFLQLEEELGLSRRQLQREERKGIDAMVAILWQRRLVDEEAVDGTPTDDLGEAQPLLQQLQTWKVERQACAVQTLVEDVRWMLDPLLQRLQATIEVTIPPRLAHVLVDPTMTRQAILRVLRLLVQSVGQGKVCLQALGSDRMVALVLQAPVANVDYGEQDWHLASLLVGRQGGNLRHQVDAAGGQKVVMELPRVSRARVLVVDDVQAAHNLFERYLAPHNYDVIGARSAGEALRLADEIRPDAIILDVMMATVDGWQALRDLRSHPSTAAIPVLVCSVLDEPDLALSLGARAFIKKPVQRLELLAALEQALSPLRQKAAH
ncbi:MAG: response regulator [Anaerolineae bacterium]|nr:response regulator [Anaerolineae bacterium]